MLKVGRTQEQDKEMMKKTEKLQRYFLYFMMYSVFGWLYEVFLEVVVYRWGFSNRGILFGPYCIIYGFGALLLLFTLTGLKKKRIYAGKILITPFLVFLGIVAVTTVTELIGSYLMADRRLDVGLPEILLRFSGQNRAEPESSFRRGRYDHSLSFSAFL